MSELLFDASPFALRQMAIRKTWRRLSAKWQVASAQRKFGGLWGLAVIKGNGNGS